MKKLIGFFTNKDGKLDFESKFAAADKRFFAFHSKTADETTSTNDSDRYLELHNRLPSKIEDCHKHHMQLHSLKINDGKIRKCNVGLEEFKKLYNAFDFKCIVTDIDFADSYWADYMSIDRPYNDYMVDMEHAFLMLEPLNTSKNYVRGNGGGDGYHTNDILRNEKTWSDFLTEFGDQYEIPVYEDDKEIYLQMCIVNFIRNKLKKHILHYMKVNEFHYGKSTLSNQY